MNEAYLILGGNIPDRMEYLNWAIHELKLLNIHIDAQSNIYETDAWGSNSHLAYLNLALKIRTEVEAQILLTQLHEIEEKLGRKRTSEAQYADRTVDIDILFFNNQLIKTDTLEIPHPRLHLRQFVLQPLLEIAHNYIHPVFEQTIEALFLQCQDTLAVRPYHLSK
jgi:2-amino-4-hydroxy-6-hydroxymethyldihydropteridine diphosphokinase